MSEVEALLVDHPGATNLVVLPGAGREPEGDLVLVDVAREAASEVLAALRGMGVDERGSIAVEEVDLSLSLVARRAEQLAPGQGDDAVVWDQLEARTREDASLTVNYLVLFSVATALAGIAVVLDSAILVVGAMIVGPEFGALAGVCTGIVRRRRAIVTRGLLALLVGFSVSIFVAAVVTAMLTAFGLMDTGALFEPRPQTAFIYLPDVLSFVVAFLAGIAGMQALTAAKSGAVLGVLVSVTTIPAAGNIAVAVAHGFGPDPERARSEYLDQAWTSTGQLLLNLAGIVLAGTITLAIHRRRSPSAVR